MIPEKVLISILEGEPIKGLLLSILCLPTTVITNMYFNIYKQNKSLHFSGCCMDRSWYIFTHQAWGWLPSCCWSLLESKHCKHCWIHQVQQRYVLIEKFLVKIYCPSYFALNWLASRKLVTESDRLFPINLSIIVLKIIILDFALFYYVQSCASHSASWFAVQH